MKTNGSKNKSSLELLRELLSEMPKAELQAIINEVSEMGIEGVSAKEYFDDFSTPYIDMLFPKQDFLLTSLNEILENKNFSFSGSVSFNLDEFEWCNAEYFSPPPNEIIENEYKSTPDNSGVFCLDLSHVRN